MLKYFSILFWVFCWGLSLSAQQKAKLPEDTAIKNYFSFGGQILNRGWTAGIQYQRNRVNDKHHFVLQLSHIKDRGEKERESLFQAQSGTSFIMNKVNYLMLLHLGYGRSYMLIEKDKFSRARLSAVFSVGPTLGLIVPYRIYKFVPDPVILYEGTRMETSFYEPVPYSDVIGKVGFVSGARNMKYCFALTAQGGLQLDLGEKEDFIRAVTLGLRMDYFYRGVTIMVPNTNHWFFSGGIGFIIGNAW